MAEKIYRRSDLALQQLNTALDLFLDHQNYPAAITLAGASEEMFGKSLQGEKKESALDQSFRDQSEIFSIAMLSKLDRKDFVAEKNKARNAMKHLQKDQGPTIALDLQEAACWMLVRAIQNARDLGLSVKRYSDFDNWFYENIVGV